MGRFFRKFFATLLMFVFIGIFLTTAFCFAFYQTFFNVDFYKKDLVKAAHDFVVHEGQKYMDFQPIAAINKSDFVAIMDTVVSAKDLEGVVNDVAEQVRDLKVGQDGIVELIIPLDWLERKSGVFSEKIVDYLFENLPRCELGEEDYFKEFNCLPTGLSKDDFASAFRLALDRKLISDLPNDFNFQFVVPNQFRGLNVGAFIDGVTSKFFFVLIGALLLMLACIGLLIFSPWSAVMKWVAKTVFLSSLFTILTAMILNISVPVIFDKLVHSFDVSILNYNAWISIYILFAGAFTVNLLKVIFPLAIISLGFWIVGMLFYRNKSVTSYGDSEINTGYQDLH